MKAADLHTVKSIAQSIDYLEANLTREVTIAHMAESVHYSLYHYSRMFNLAVQHTPYEFIMRRRLSEAAVQLLETDKKIIDIALDFLFNSPEAFSRAFKRMFDMQPSQWRKQGLKDTRRIMPRLTLPHLLQRTKENLPPPQEINRDKFYLMGIMGPVMGNLLKRPAGYLPPANTVAPNTVAPNTATENKGREDHTTEQDSPKRRYRELLEEELSRVPQLRDLSSGPGTYGISFYPPKWQGQDYHYFAGREVEGPEAMEHIPPDSPLVLKTIGAQKYTRFMHRGPVEDLGLMLDYIYHTWLAKREIRPGGRMEIEEHGETNTDPIGVLVPMD